MGGQYLSYFHQKKKNKYGQNKAVGKPTVFILSQEIDYNRTTVQRRTDHKNNTKSNSAETHLKKHRKAGKNNEIYEQPLWSVKNF